VIFMRPVIIDKYDDLEHACGFDGEHLATELSIVIPADITLPEGGWYEIMLKNADGLVVLSGPLTPEDNHLKTGLWQQVNVEGPLEAQIVSFVANTVEGEDPLPISMSPVVKLTVGHSITGAKTAKDTVARGLIAELQGLRAIVDTPDDLPETAPDGSRITVRYRFNRGNFAKMESIELNATELISIENPILYVNTWNTAPDWNEIEIDHEGIMAKVSAMGAATGSNDVQFSITTVIFYSTKDPEDPDDQDKIFYLDQKTGRAFAYLIGISEFIGLEGNNWYELLYFDKDTGSNSGIKMRKPPPIYNNSILTFVKSDGSTPAPKAYKYFETVLSPEPYEYQQYVRDNAAWQLCK